MISLLLIGVYLIFALPATAQDDGVARLVVVAEALNVRAGPGINYPAIDVLWQDDQVEITGRHPASGWWQITLPGGGSGWVTGVPLYVQVNGDTSGVPEVATAPVSPAKPVSDLPIGTDGGTVVFQTTSGGPIYAINADGTNLRFLTTGLDPVLSPNGKWVAFSRWDSPGFAGTGSLWVINVDGTGERIVLAGIVGHPKSPTWSPDGKQIVFNMQLDGGHPGDLRVCGRDSVPPEAFDIEWVVSENGKGSFCYTLPPKSFWGLRLVDVDTGTFRDLPHDTHAFSPTWDPVNPGHLVFDGERGLINVDLNQDTIGPLTEDPLDHSPVFSPDGQRLVVTYLQHDHWDIHVLNADGSDRMRLTETPLLTIIEQRLRGEEPRIWNNVAASWSPDGSQIVFLSDRNGQWQIWVMNADGSEQRLMFPPDTLAAIGFEYYDVDERMISWGP